MKKTLKVLLTTLTLAIGLAGCSSNSSSTSTNTNPSTDTEQKVVDGSLDKTAYTSLITSGVKASDATINANEWAKAVKANGTLKVGGTETSYLFSLRDVDDNQMYGFDSGLYELLSNYIFGSPYKYEITKVTSSTRESVLTSDAVDVVFATYSITDKRKEVIDFAGPYYTSRQAILVTADNTTITGLDSLAGKTVATQTGSTGPTLLAEYAPQATVQSFDTDANARLALEQGRVDAYVTDYTLMLNAMFKSPNTYKIAGDVFGPEDNYGIGVKKGSDAVSFINTFLKTIEEDGTWAKLWKVTLGDRVGIETAPKAPTID